MTRLWLVFGLLLLSVMGVGAQETPITFDSFGQVTETARYGGGAFTRLSIAPDGSRLAATMGLGGVRLFENGNLSGAFVPLANAGREVRDTAFSPDGARLAVAYGDGALEMFDLATQSVLWSAAAHDGRVVADVLFSPDGARLVSGGWDSTIQFWDAASGSPLQTVSVSFSVSYLAYSPDGTRVLAAGNSAVLIDAAAGAQLAELSGHSDFLGWVGFSPDSATAYSTSFDGTLKVWAAADGAEQRSLALPVGVGSGVTLDPQNPAHVIFYAGDGNLYRVDGVSGEVLGSGLAPAALSQLVTDASTGALYAVSPDRGLLLVDAALGVSVVTADIPSQINSIALTPDGRVAVGLGNGVVLSVDVVQNDTRILVAASDAGGVRDLAYADSYRYLVVLYSSRLIRVYETGGYQQVAETSVSTSTVVVSPDGTRLLTLGNQPTVYALPDLSVLADLSAIGNVTEGAFSADGARLAVATRAEGVSLLDGQTYARVVDPLPSLTSAEFPNPGTVTALAFTRDSGELIVSWNTYSYGLYDAQTGALNRSAVTDYNLAQELVLSPDGGFAIQLDFRDMIALDWATLVEGDALQNAYSSSVVDGVFNRSATRLYVLARESVVRVFAIP